MVYQNATFSSGETRVATMSPQEVANIAFEKEDKRRLIVEFKNDWVAAREKRLKEELGRVPTKQEVGEAPTPDEYQFGRWYLIKHKKSAVARTMPENYVAR
jgi:hypothetical protein